MNKSHLKRISTTLKKYGVDNVSKLKAVQQKRRQTFASHRNILQIEYPPINYIVDGHQLNVYRLNKHVSDEWLNRYHPMKAPKGNVMCLGLVENNTIYCLMTFKKAKDTQHIAELSRMWTLPGYYVKDGYDILSRLAIDLGLYDIIAYVHVPLENPKNYVDIGMSLLDVRQRTKWWIKNNNILSDASRRQMNISIDQLHREGWMGQYDQVYCVYEFRA